MVVSNKKKGKKAEVKSVDKAQQLKNKINKFGPFVLGLVLLSLLGAFLLGKYVSSQAREPEQAAVFFTEMLNSADSQDKYVCMRSCSQQFRSSRTKKWSKGNLKTNLEEMRNCMLECRAQRLEIPRPTLKPVNKEYIHKAKHFGESLRPCAQACLDTTGTNQDLSDFGPQLKTCIQACVADFKPGSDNEVNNGPTGSDNDIYEDLTDIVTNPDYSKWRDCFRQCPMPFKSFSESSGQQVLEGVENYRGCIHSCLGK